jgi:predicted metal-dependent hydrolase
VTQHHDALLTGRIIYESRSLPTDAPNEYAKFWSLWRAEKFYECHEVLEELWTRTTGRQRWFYNGLINCAVAVYQHRRGNCFGACRQLWRAQTKLQPFHPQHEGVEIHELLQSVEQEIAASLNQLSNAQKSQQRVVQESVEKRMARDFGA